MRFLLFLCLCQASLAFGPVGHRAVALIAQEQLDGPALAKVQNILGGRELWMVSNWADDMRSEPEFKQADFWHWITWEGREKYKRRRTGPMLNILDKIHDFSESLMDANATKESQEESLKWLVHLVADLHQPLHVGRAQDKGGNDTQVMFFERKVNLHSVWDDHIIDHLRLPFRDLAMDARFFCEREASISSLEPESWAEESYALLPKVYDIGEGTLEYVYVYKSSPLIRKRICEAGYRLGHLLNRALGGKS